MKKNQSIRKDLVIATKVCGRAHGHAVARLRNAKDCRLDRDSIITACNASLKRLNVDYIDLYQLHWPDRYVPIFDTQCYVESKEHDDDVPISETLGALKQLLDEGKIKA